MIHRIKSMWFTGNLEIALTHCGEHGHVVEDGDVVKIQTSWEFIHGALGNHGDKVDCPKCRMQVGHWPA